MELGCGCGLVGFTAAQTLPEQYVVFTDGSSDCLDLVRRSGAAMGVTLTDGTRAQKGTPGPCACHATSCGDGAYTGAGMTYPLEWNEEGICAFRDAVRRYAGARTQERPPCDDDATQPRVRADPFLGLVLGSDLMYYRVDVNAFVRTCARLLDAFEDAGKNSSTLHETRPPPQSDVLSLNACKQSDGVVSASLMDVTCGNGNVMHTIDTAIKSAIMTTATKPGEDAGVLDAYAGIVFIALAHHMRIPNGRNLLAVTARQYGFAIVSIPLTTFLTAELLHSRGWAGLELVLLARRPDGAGADAAHPGGESEVADGSESDAAAWADVHFVRHVLSRRVDHLAGVALHTGSFAHPDAVRIASARHLCRSVARYPPETVHGRSIPGEASPEGDFMSLFL